MWVMPQAISKKHLMTVGTRENGFGGQLWWFANDIKLAHTVFAMPFALLSGVMALTASHGSGSQADRSLSTVAWQLGWIVVCMFLARSFAMGMNRLLDADLDRLNPRTASRAIPGGRLSRRSATVIVTGLAACFAGATTAFGFMFDNWWPAWLSIPALAFIGVYPLLKRFTWLCHLYLGMALGLAPICAWVAIAATVEAAPLLLGAAVLAWTSGFDVLYACQDMESDRSTGVFSLPARIGIARSLWIARLLHGVAVVCLVLMSRVVPELEVPWLVAVGVVLILLTYEHWLVRPNDLRRLNFAFFKINGVISLILGLVGILDVLVN
jgi:4-hydroxybenzoate polyprenyltransferase